MTPVLTFEGPRLLRREDRRASHRLSCLCFGGDPDSFRDDVDYEESGETYVMTAEGVPVSQITISLTPLKVLDSTIQVGSIGGVCTHPDYRGHELARKLLRFCTERLAEKGAHVLLISGGRGLYTRAGCVFAGKFASFTLDAENAHSPTENLALRRPTVGDAAWASRLYQSDAVHFERGWGTFAEHFAEHGKAGWSEDWVVELDGQAAAYFVMTTPWENTPADGIRWLHEYAGSRVALAGGFQKLIIDGFCKELSVRVPWQDVDLIHLLEQLGKAATWECMFEHTMRVLDLPGMVAALQPTLAARLAPAVLEGLRFAQSGPLLEGQGQGGFVVSLGEERLELDGLDMTRLVMGNVEGVAALTAALTALPDGRLGEALRAVFPLPSFLAGMDYH